VFISIPLLKIIVINPPAFFQKERNQFIN